MKKETIPVILGPTCVGKTEIAIEFAERYGVEIISCDSRQVYRYMDIGTAKPTKDEQRRVKHHLIDVCEPDTQMNAFHYAILARQTIRKLKEEKKKFIVSGGSGLYMKALFEGFFELPPSEDISKVRAKIKKMDKSLLYERLIEVDPSSAEEIHPNDTQRIIRALEVYEFTGKRLSSWKLEGRMESGFGAIKVGLWREKEELHKRIDNRVLEMIKRGLIKEVEDLLMCGYSSSLPSLQTVGYSEVIDYLNGKITLKEAVYRIKRNTKLLAKRQMTWFGKENVDWIKLNKDSKKNEIVEILYMKFTQLEYFLH